MKSRTRFGLYISIAIVAVISTTAQAQLVSSWNAPRFDDGVGVDRTNSWVTDVGTGDFIGLVDFPTSRAMAADNELDLLYISGGSAITTFGLDANGALENLGSSPRIHDASGREAQSGQVVGLGVADGVLYASVTRRLGDEQRNRGIERGFYSIDPTTGEATLLRSDAEIDLFVGMDYSPEDGLMYGVVGPINGQSIVAFDLDTFDVVLVTNIPISEYGGGTSTFDGVAVNERTIFLTSGRDTLPIAVFDLVTGTFGPSLPNPPRFGENTSYPGGSTFFQALGEPAPVPVPVPGVAIGLGVGGLLLAARKLPRRTERASSESRS